MYEMSGSLYTAPTHAAKINTRMCSSRRDHAPKLHARESARTSEQKHSCTRDALIRISRHSRPPWAARRRFWSPPSPSLHTPQKESATCSRGAWRVCISRLLVHPSQRHPRSAYRTYTVIKLIRSRKLILRAAAREDVAARPAPAARATTSRGGSGDPSAGGAKEPETEPRSRPGILPWRRTRRRLLNARARLKEKARKDHDYRAVRVFSHCCYFFFFSSFFLSPFRTPLWRRWRGRGDHCTPPSGDINAHVCGSRALWPTLRGCARARAIFLFGIEGWRMRRWRCIMYTDVLGFFLLVDWILFFLF